MSKYIPLSHFGAIFICLTYSPTTFSQHLLFTTFKIFLGTVRSKKKMTQSEMLIFLSIFIQIRKYFSWKSGRIISFFPHINTAIRPLIQKLSAWIHFFTFLKSWKKCTLTRIFTIWTKWLYQFSWFFGIRIKHSIPIFSTTQNSIWMRFHESREFSKMFIFALIDDFFGIFLTVLCI